jgi:hypothetical protein
MHQVLSHITDTITDKPFLSRVQNHHHTLSMFLAKKAGCMRWPQQGERELREATRLSVAGMYIVSASVVQRVPGLKRAAGSTFHFTQI